MKTTARASSSSSYRTSIRLIPACVVALLVIPQFTRLVGYSAGGYTAPAKAVLSSDYPQITPVQNNKTDESETQLTALLKAQSQLQQDKMTQEIQTLKTQLEEGLKAKQQIEELSAALETTKHLLAHEKNQSSFITSRNIACSEKTEPSNPASNALHKAPITRIAQDAEGDASSSSSHSLHLNSSVCDYLSTRSSMGLWTQNMERIHKAGKLPQDKQYQEHNLMATILHLISPRLPMSTKSVPRDWKPVQALIAKANAWYHYNNNSGSATAPPDPIRILVMGGSVTMGINCKSFRSPKMNQSKCAWSNRLENFLNNFFSHQHSSLGGMFRVEAIATGGINTDVGRAVWEYDLVPEKTRGIDIVINAFSTNDMHVITMNEAKNGGKTLRDKVFEMIQDFSRLVLEPRPCQTHAPLLLHLDDYLGNEQHEILATMELSQAVHTLSSYYGFASVSYSDMVRDFVYGDTQETMFSPAGWYKNGGYKREIHPQVGMHIATSFVIAYNLLNLATTYCAGEMWNSKPLHHRMLYNTTIINGLPEFKKGSQVGSTKPIAPPEHVLLPELTPTLQLKNITAAWRKDSGDKSLGHDCTKQDSTASIMRCPFSWVSGITDKFSTTQTSKEAWMKERFSSVAKDFGDWYLADIPKKHGLSPRLNATIGAEMTLQFTNLNQSIHEITMFTMKSYGENWDNSRVKLTIFDHQVVGVEADTSVAWKLIKSAELEGFHNKTTSEMYTERIVLSEPVSAGRSLKLTVTLVSGKTFKIMGLAICS
jgi:hypothetical protein